MKQSLQTCLHAYTLALIQTTRSLPQHTERAGRRPESAQNVARRYLITRFTSVKTDAFPTCKLCSLLRGNAANIRVCETNNPNFLNHAWVNLKHPLRTFPHQTPPMSCRQRDRACKQHTNAPVSVNSRFATRGACVFPFAMTLREH